jgi:hypothetical protein
MPKKRYTILRGRIAIHGTALRDSGMVSTIALVSASRGPGGGQWSGLGNSKDHGIVTHDVDTDRVSKARGDYFQATARVYSEADAGCEHGEKFGDINAR